jgi:adenylosuccinate synthase
MRSAASSATDKYATRSKLATVLGAQWGDEGKGKLVDILAKEFDIIARFNGGANAGHTLVVDGKKFPFHLLPCGMLYPGKLNVIGNGVVLDIGTMMKELEILWAAGFDTKESLVISDRAHIVLQIHKDVDGNLEKKADTQGTAIGTTRRGIGPTYSSKAKRDGLRVGELVGDWETFAKRHTALCESISAMYGVEGYDIAGEQAKLKAWADVIRPWVKDTVSLLNHALNDGKSVLAEGANACLLDMDFGTYPYVTSSSTTVGGIATGLGVAPTKLGSVIGVVKAYTTRVGAGPFPTELTDVNGKELCRVGHEFGTTTGRERRCGWLDIPVLRYSNFINGYTSLNITKLDVLSGFDEIKIGTHYTIDGKRLPEGHMPSTIPELAKVKVEYETVPGWKSDISKVKSFAELPVNAQKYVSRVEELVGVPVSYIGVGPARNEMISTESK